MKGKNFTLFSGDKYYTPGFGGLTALLAWFIFGAILGAVVSAILGTLLGADFAMSEGMLVSYPIMFIPAMMFVSLKGKTASFDTQAFELDGRRFGSAGGAACAVMAVLATIGAAFMTDLINSKMPPMPPFLEEALKSMTQGKFWVNFLSVSIFAPICEEWLCRGMILRSLLHFERKDGSRGIPAVWAIIISAGLFAAIHGNPWQAIPAFILGCLFGYVYHKTGSLKLTMLMHCANNSFALICGQIPAFEDMDYWTDVLDGKTYGIIFAACALLLILILRSFSRIREAE